MRTNLILLFVIETVDYIIQRFDYPITPTIIKLILKPITKKQLQQTLTINQNNPITLINSPFTAIVYSLLTITIIITTVLRIRTRHKHLQQPKHPKQTEQPTQMD